MDEELIKIALGCGASKAALISGGDIVFDAQFRKLCVDNACGRYGRCWMCPPFIGEIEPLMKRAAAYPRALLYQTVYAIEDSYDIEGMTAAARAHALLGKRLRQALDGLLPDGVLYLSCGGWNLCDEYAKVSGQPCRFPDDAQASLEGCGIDVYNTAKSTDLLYINGKDTVTYFGIVLFGERSCAG